MLAFVGALDIARRELADGDHVDNLAAKAFVRVGIDSDFYFLAKPYFAELRFGDIDLDPHVGGAQDTHDGLIWRGDVSPAYCQDLDQHFARRLHRGLGEIGLQLLKLAASLSRAGV